MRTVDQIRYEIEGIRKEKEIAQRKLEKGWEAGEFYIKILTEEINDLIAELKKEETS